MPTDSFKSYPSQFILFFKEEKKVNKKKKTLKRYSKTLAGYYMYEKDSKKIDMRTEANELSMAPGSDFRGLLKKTNMFKEVNAITISLSSSKCYYQ